MILRDRYILASAEWFPDAMAACWEHSSCPRAARVAWRILLIFSAAWLCSAAGAAKAKVGSETSAGRAKSASDAEGKSARTPAAAPQRQETEVSFPMVVDDTRFFNNVTEERTGAPLKIRLSSQDQYSRIFFSSAEGQLATTLLEELEATDIVLDVGAEVGAFALTAGRRGVASVTAIEADSALAESLEESASLNGLSESFLVLTWLASSSSGYATVFAKAARGCTYSAGVTTNHSTEEFTRPVLTAPTRSVDEAVAHGLIARPTVVRISMEGAEEFALEGMDGLLSDAENSPRVVLLVCLCESFCVSAVCM